LLHTSATYVSRSQRLQT